MASKPQPKRERWAPALYERADIIAIQALATGTASEGQQKRALDWIVFHAAGTYDDQFVSGRDDERCFLLGRRNVGLQIVKLMKLKPELFPT